MPVRSSLLLAVFATLAIAVPAAAAPPVTVTPQSIGKPIGTVITTEYDAFGLLFGQGRDQTLDGEPADAGPARPI